MNLVPASIGIDLGCYTSKIAVAKRGGVEIITNEANFRQTPSVVGFGNAQRQIGEAGNIKMKSNFRDTVLAPMRFCGLPADYPMLRAQTKYCPARSNISSGKLLFQVNYQGQKQSLEPQQLLAAYFNKLKTIVARNGFENKQAVIAIPSYLTQQQRKAYLDAAKIAQLNVTRLINSSTAIALDYGMFRKADLDATKPRNVLFLDFGHAKFGAFTCSFTKQEMNVLDQTYSRNLGCRDIDYHMLQFYRQIFQGSSGCDLSENRKAIVKLMQYIEKQRKILTGINEHQMSVEYLMEENDLQYTMTRQKFEHICQPIIKEITQIFNSTKQSLSNKKIELHSIQLIGGGSRIPFFIQLVKDIFGIEPSRTLNSSESVARGCALMAAIKSPLFKVPDYGLHQRNYYPVKFCWNFVQNNQYLGPNAEAYPQKQQKIIFDDGAKIPTSKTIKFTRKEAIQILIQYFPAVNGFNRYIGYFITSPQHPKQQNFGVSFKLKFNENGLITFEECYLVEQWTEQVKVPKKKAQKKETKEGQKKQGQKMQVEGEEEFEIKKNKKQKHTQIKYQSNTFDAHTPQDINKLFTFESTMMNQDRIILETYEKKNQLQSMIYNWKQKLNGSHKQFIQANDIPPIIAFLEQNNQWLYSEGQQANRGTYATKIDGIKAKIDPVQKRYDNFIKIVQELHNLMACLKQNFDFVNSLEQKYNHITPQERQQGINLIEQTKFWMQKAEQDQANKPKWQNPVISVSDVQNKIKGVNEACWKIMSKPAPKVEEKPKEEKTQNPAEPPKQKMDVQNNGTSQNGKPE